jgi:hypothetical protein
MVDIPPSAASNDDKYTTHFMMMVLLWFDVKGQKGGSGGENKLVLAECPS